MSTYRHDNTKGTTRDVNAGTKAAKALELRAQKLTYDEIAVRCGFDSRGSAHHAVQRELQRVVVTNVEELRREELHMLNVMHSEVWELFTDKKNRWRLSAADRILAIAERRARLMGLDTATDAVAAGVTVIRSYDVETQRV
jgi:uncharacterized protein HemX